MLFHRAEQFVSSKDNRLINFKGYEIFLFRAAHPDDREHHLH